VIAVLDYGIGNLRSAEKALEHLGASARLVRDAAGARGATGVVLPGVGNFGACATALRESGLDAVAREAFSRAVPFFGICVGFQLLFEASEESPDVPGLGLLAGSVRRLSDAVKLPQMQWNQLERRARTPESAMLAGLAGAPWCYFVHTYAPVPADEQDAGVVATCEYGGSVVAAIERGNCWGTQFHPEKSGATGLRVLANFVARCGGYERDGGAPIAADGASAFAAH
jgi:imidazole glycerol-phosphate synthase subunit HisH